MILWIGIAVGILLLIVIFHKGKTTNRTDYIKISLTCKKCGFRTNGLKCPACNKKETGV